MSLFDLIYNNSQRNDSQESKSPKGANKSAEDAYEFDPYDSFYGRDDENENISRSESATNTKKSKEKKYDFQKLSQDRDFYLSETAKAQQKAKQEKLRRSKGRLKRIAEETHEETKKRLEQNDIRVKRRRRFRFMRYNFKNEIDYNWSVSKMVKLQMHVNDEFKTTKKRKIKGDDVESNSDDREKDKIATKSEVDEDTIGSTSGTNRSSGSGVSSNSNSESSGSSSDSNSESSSDSDSSDSNDIFNQIRNKRHKKEKEQGQRALGSLLDRIKKDEDEAKRVDNLGNEYGKLKFREQMDLMKKDPMAFLKHGYNSPVPQDPNKDMYYMRYVAPFKTSKLKGVVGNELYFKEKDRLKKVIDQLPIRMKKPTKTDKLSLAAAYPLNCFNPSISRMKKARSQDTYHYLPLSRREPTSLRLKTAKNDSTDNIFSPFDETRFFQKQLKTYYPLEFHSRSLHLLTARLLVSCAGLINADDNNKSRNVNSLSRIFEMLYRKKNNSNRSGTIIWQSQELASNYIFWKEIEDRVCRLLSKNLIDVNEYHLLRKELLSDQGTMFCDPNTDIKSLRTIAYERRRKIIMFVSHIENSDVMEEKKVNSWSTDDLNEQASRKHQNENEDENVEDSNKRENEAEIILGSYTKKNALEPKSSYLKTMNMEEKYSQVAHYTDPDLDTVRLTLATMLSELCHQRSRRLYHKKSKHGRISHYEEETMHKTIMSYLDRITDERWYEGSALGSKFHQTYLMNGPITQTVLMKQSYIAHNCSTSFQSNVESDEVEKKKSKKEELKTNFVAAAKALYSFGIPLYKDVKVSIFPGIHVTTGIALIAGKLPPYAAEILSRPLRANYQIVTPFELMRLTFETLERNGDITRSNDDHNTLYGDEGGITIDSLIFTLDQAVEIFQECVSLNSEDLSNMSWLLASQMTRMLIGSGLVIGGGPRNALPPETDDFNGSTRHINYNKQRASTSRTFRQVISWQSQGRFQGTHYNFMIKSCLEWYEVMFLLSFRPSYNRDYLPKLRLLHASHYITWALKEPSIDSLNTILFHYQEGLITRMKVLSFLSTLVEMDATNAKYWAMLACALGPIGSIDSRKCAMNDCSQCNKLRKGRFNHKKLQKQKRKHDWWGSDKIKWWDTHFLISPSCKKAQECLVANEINIGSISKQIETVCVEKSPICTLVTETKVRRNLMDVSWMWPAEPSDEDEDDYLNSDSDSDDNQENQRSKHGEKNFGKLPGQKPAHELIVESSSQTLINDIGLHRMISVSKILVCCHLYSADHPFVDASVVNLWRDYLQDRQKSKTLKSLCFLATQNLDVVSCLSYLARKGCMKIRSNLLFPFSFTTVQNY